MAYVVAVALVFTAPAAAHPGSLDKHGCHTSRERFTYADGRVVEPGTRHCHKLIGRIPLDGSQHLEGAPSESRAEPARTVPRRPAPRPARP